MTSPVPIAIEHTWGQAHHPPRIVTITGDLAPRCARRASARRRAIGWGYIEEEAIVSRGMDAVGPINRVVVVRACT